VARQVKTQDVILASHEIDGKFIARARYPAIAKYKGPGSTDDA
jgi:hypothetical protein